MNNTELANKVREAHDNILTYGWKKGKTILGKEDQGLCIGSALAMAFGEEALGAYDYLAFTNSRINAYGDIRLGESLCDNGKALTPYLREAMDEVGKKDGRFIHHWNDNYSTTEDMVLDVLINTEKALREADDS